MSNDLLINNIDAYEHGVTMGSDFLSTLDTPAPLKEFQSNESRDADGVEYLTTSDYIHVDEREITLNFVIQASASYTFRENRAWFLEQVNAGKLTVYVPSLADEVYTLIYQGKSITYSLNLARDLCKFAAKFTECNPADRPTYKTYYGVEFGSSSSDEE